MASGMLDIASGIGEATCGAHSRREAQCQAVAGWPWMPYPIC